MVLISSSVHTRLENGLALRKEVLEAALRTTEILQAIKVYKEERRKKLLMINKYKKEITALVNKVHELEFKDLPKNITREIESEIEPRQPTKEEIRQEIEERFEEPLVKSEVEQEIEDLREKINNLKI